MVLTVEHLQWHPGHALLHRGGRALKARLERLLGGGRKTSF